MSGARIVLALVLGSWLIAGYTTFAKDAEETSSGLFHLVETDPVPDDAIRVCESCANNDLQATIDSADEGVVIVVVGGSWAPVSIDKPLRLAGEDWPVIDAMGKGSGITIASADVTVEGFDIRSTGRSFDHEDSGIYFEGERVRILNNRLSEVLFGVNGALGHDSEIAGNTISGQTGVSEGLRGDGLKIWYSHRVQIHNNDIRNVRDSLVWYSNECNVYENSVQGSRYGFHFMNSDDGVARRNSLVDNSVGIYIMYGKRFTVADNLLEGSRGPSGQGLGLKEVDGFEVTGNLIYDNRVGIYNDNSPYSIGQIGWLSDNVIAYNDSGLGIVPSARDNIYTHNSFVENLEQVTVLGSGALSSGNQWSYEGVGNFWSDYSGYDADGDGVGDIPYQNTSIAEELRRTHPQLQLFRFSLAERAIDFAAQAMPLFEAEAILMDDSPLVNAPTPQNAPEVTSNESTLHTTALSVSLMATVGAGIWWARRPGAGLGGA
ncbi:MAG: nitrous oxide reductase family maturation protein NosD [Thermomicrobiales bacterium]|nr:nitrous oxide reductase family maturation protein NosD [Thermomicrobiales bacterium]